MADTFASQQGLSDIFIQRSGGIRTKPLNSQIEEYLATS